MARKKKPTFDRGQAVREIARERVGVVPGRKIIQDRKTKERLTLTRGTMPDFGPHGDGAIEAYERGLAQEEWLVGDEGEYEEEL